MKRMIDTEKFLDKLLYMGYMDEEKSEVEEVANRMTEESYTKDEVIAMLTEIQLEIEEKSYYDTTIIGNYEDEARTNLVELDDVNDIIQQKINELKAESEDKND